ncbi:MAG: RIP metalloprotease RseP [Turicibacter sp.]|nr:RIP metalloprotease RseP [Turicibacter sp.]MBQ1785866.1 RIP metalloprotease RseP [Turicibacter sp.]
MIGVLSFILALGIIILVHELGHFLVAKHYGILCHEFSIGMGPAVWSKKRGETTYSIRAIPFGGYVAMAGEEAEKEMVKVDQVVGLSFNSNGLVNKIFLKPESSNPDIIGSIKELDLYKTLTICLQKEDGSQQTFSVEHDAEYILEKGTQQIAPYDRCLESKSKWARFATMAAGATMNFVLALVLFFIVGLSVGMPTYSNTLGGIVEQSPAHVAGLQAGDTIISYNGQTVTNWQDLTNAIQSTTETTTITYSRNGQTSTIEITPEISDREGTKVAMLGIEPEYKKSFLTGLEYSVLKTKEAFVSIFETFKMLFVTKEAGINDLSGPVGIYTMTSTIATYGLTSLLIWIGFLSVNIGVMNLLPIPALDGGRILFVLIESIIGRPVDRRIEGYIHTVGLLLFFGLFVYVTFNDIIRLITA